MEIIFLCILGILLFLCLNKFSSKKTENFQTPNKLPQITVIIPSIGRDTLKRTIDSLLKQNQKKWKAIIGFDAIDKKKANMLISNLPKDKRIEYLYIKDKLGQGKNSAGKVRNNLINICTTDWICFLDDDDTFTPDYFDRFIEELDSQKNLDTIIFRMIGKTNLSPIPPYGLNEIIEGKVGISFAVRKKFLTENDIKFVNSNVEDFILLKEIKNKNGNIKISKHTTYHIGF